MLSGFAGVLWTLRFASARYDSGIGLELYVVTIVLLGGISIFGGRGTILGVVLAVAVLGTLQTALTQDLVPAQDQNIVVGGLLLASVIVPNARDMYGRARTRLRSREARRQPRGRGACGGAVKGRHLRDRPGSLLAAVRGAARPAQGVPAWDRGTARRASAPKLCLQASSTLRRPLDRLERRSLRHNPISSSSMRRLTPRPRRSCRSSRRSVLRSSSSICSRRGHSITRP